MHGTSTMTELLPTFVTRSRRLTKVSRSTSHTLRKPDGTPPAAYVICPSKRALNASLSLPITSRWCVAWPSSRSSSSTVLYAAVPAASIGVVRPSQKWML